MRITFEQAEQLILELISMDQYKREKRVKELTKDELESIRYRVGYFAAAANDLKRSVKLQIIVSQADYEKYIKHAAKHFNDIDIAILEGLNHNDESAYYYQGLISKAQEWLVDNDREEKLEDFADGTTGENAQYNAVKGSVKKLKRRGLLLHVTGLFGDDGTAGSGFMVNPDLFDTVQKIVDSYRGVTDQEALL